MGKEAVCGGGPRRSVGATRAFFLLPFRQQAVFDVNLTSMGFDCNIDAAGSLGLWRFGGKVITADCASSWFLMSSLCACSELPKAPRAFATESLRCCWSC